MKSGRTKRVGMAAAGLIAAVSMAACSGGGGTSEGQSRSGGGSDTIHWLSSRNASDTTMQTVDRIVGMYKEDHPEFNLEIEYVPDRPAYLQKVKILASSGELPEWFDADPEPYFAEIVKSGAVVDVRELYDELGVTDDFYPISIQYPELPDGSLNLITFNANAEYFFYNKDVFAEAGVEAPKNLDEVLSICDAARDVGKVGMSVAGRDRWPYYRFLAMPAFRATGNEFLMELSEGKALMTDPVGIDSSTFLQQVGERCFQPGFTTGDTDTALNMMKNGEAALFYTGSWDISSFLDDNKEMLPNIGMFTLPPVWDQDQTAPTDFFVNSGIGTAIRTDALNDSMKDFLKFFFEKYPDLSLYEFDTLPSLKPEIRDDLPEIYKRILDDISQVTDYARVWDVVLDANTVDTMAREAESLTLGMTTPEQFGQAIDSAVAASAPSN